VFEAFPVDHSVNDPAVGYRITGGQTAIFYVPDVLGIPDRGETLARIALYIGDGATISRPIVRRQGDVLIGHAPISTQLDWCAEAGVPRAIFTHCGTRIVDGGLDVEGRIPTLGRAKRLDAQVAHDGLRIRVP
jgi:phosphoribosyl 1,2-cyclic phosphodiesterase